MSTPIPPTFVPRRILVAAHDHAEIALRLSAARPDLEFREMAASSVTPADLLWADTFIGFRHPRTDDMGNVQWVHSTAAGVDGWFFPKALAPSILLTRTSESFGPRIAEWVLARALAITQEIFPLRFAQQQKEWSQRAITELRGSRVLVVGTGDIGTHVGRLFAAMGCRVTGVSRSGDSDGRVFEARATVDQLPSLIPDAQWIVLTIPLTNDTHHLFNRDLLSRCKAAVLMNVGRGGVIDEAELPAALENGWLHAVALDVFEVEPLPSTSPLWLNPRVIVSPHMSGVTTISGVIDGFIESHAAIERGDTLKWRIDHDRGY